MLTRTLDGTITSVVCGHLASVRVALGCVVVMMLVHLMTTMLMKRNFGDPAEPVVMTLHALQHRRRRRVGQRHAKQQDQ